MPDENSIAAMGHALLQLREAGVEVAPSAQLTTYERPAGNARVVVVDRVGEPVPYRVTAYAQCCACDHMTCLDNESQALVLAGAAVPMCIPCGKELLVGQEPFMRIQDDAADGSDG